MREQRAQHFKVASLGRHGDRPKGLTIDIGDVLSRGHQVTHSLVVPGCRSGAQIVQGLDIAHSWHGGLDSTRIGTHPPHGRDVWQGLGQVEGQPFR